MPKENNKDRQMASNLKAKGFPHGRTGTTTHAPPIPPRDQVGSAAYRRRKSK